MSTNNVKVSFQCGAYSGIYPEERCDHNDDHTSAQDPISPSHYKRGPVEAIEVIEAWIAGLPHDVGYNVGSALKYISRAPEKGDLTENLKKAEWHIKRAVNLSIKT